jgi:hypothetical protein
MVTTGLGPIVAMMGSGLILGINNAINGSGTV